MARSGPIPQTCRPPLYSHRHRGDLSNAIFSAAFPSAMTANPTARREPRQSASGEFHDALPGGPCFAQYNRSLPPAFREIDQPDKTRSDQDHPVSPGATELGWRGTV